MLLNLVVETNAGEGTAAVFRGVAVYFTPGVALSTELLTVGIFIGWLSCVLVWGLVADAVDVGLLLTGCLLPILCCGRGLRECNVDVS